MTAYTLFATGIGTCGLAWTAAGLVRLQLPEQDDAATRRRLLHGLDDPRQSLSDKQIDSTVDAVRALTYGEPADLTWVPLDVTGIGDYRRRLYDTIRAIPPGSVRTYGQVATDLGDPGGAQAVGRAMGQNPWPIVVPCHRVVAAGGRTGGFSAHGGVATKVRLLAIEQAHRPAEADTLF
jgi:methylated-DNA-[protein]-cysteine S-methyltransferase